MKRWVVMAMIVLGLCAQGSMKEDTYQCSGNYSCTNDKPPPPKDSRWYWNEEIYGSDETTAKWNLAGRAEREMRDKHGADGKWHCEPDNNVSCHKKTTTE